MGSETRDHMMREVEALLDREREVLLLGDLGAIAALAEEKTALLARLRTDGETDPALLESVREKAARNQSLLDAALHGIRRVSERLSAYRQLRRSMDTYDPLGRKATIPGAVLHRLERRA